MERKPSKKAAQGPEVIRRALENMPQSPGVYQMKDAKGRIIYVGKAKRLKSRVSSYARTDSAPNYYRHKVEAMVAKAASVEYVLTGTEKEALLLESSLIKQHRPRYNVDLRDDKSYPYFRLGREEGFPRLSLVRRPGRDKARYFGPFENVGAAKKTLNWLQRVFPLRRCSDRTLKNRSRPCLDYETGRCLAPCAQKVSAREYGELVREIEAFFAGRGEAVAAEIEKRMLRAAKAERFEQAAVLRDRWQALTRTLESQRVEKFAGEDMDVLALHDQGSACRLAVMRVRGGRIVGSRVKDLSLAALAPGEVMGQALMTHYEQGLPPPPLVLVSHIPPDPGLVAEVLGERAGRQVEIRLPQRGDKRGLVDLALDNAARPMPEDHTAKALERLKAKLGLEADPISMECVDISHLGGRLTVASVVAFSQGEPDKQNYRHYKILGLHGRPDDYAAMAEVLSRRLGGKRPAPDLLVVDGGKGQLNVAVAAAQGLDPGQRPALAALAKGREGGPDRVFVPGRKNPLNLGARDPALLLLMRIRDEAHRFAVSYNRLLRKKSLTRSILEEAPGVGPKKRARLLKAFGSLRELKRASAREMMERAGLDKGTAMNVEGFLEGLKRD